MTKRVQSTDYEFKAVGVDEFELCLTFKPEGQVLALLISQAHKAIKQKTGERVQEGKLEELLDKHVLPSQYNRLIHTFVKPILKTIYSEVGKDGIIIIREEPQKVMFYKKEGQWHIEILFNGTYHEN